MGLPSEEALLEELAAIKKLLVYALLNKHKQEHTQEDVAAALGISQSKVSRMFTKTGAKEK
jgi:DNA-directed RNA polymerase specialized sigma subunit